MTRSTSGSCSRSATRRATSSASQGVRSIRERTPKGKNRQSTSTPQTRRFTKKGEVLFGYFEARRIAAMRDVLNLVEGNPDVIRMAKIGQQNTVAPMGTALTPIQIETIKRTVSKVVIIGDNDNAGQKAVIAHGEALTEAGLNVRIMTLPGAKPKMQTNISNTKEPSLTKNVWPRTRPTSWTSCTKPKPKGPYRRTTNSKSSTTSATYSCSTTRRWPACTSINSQRKGNRGKSGTRPTTN